MEFNINKTQKWVWVALILIISFFIGSLAFEPDYSSIAPYVTVGILSIIFLFLGYLAYGKWIKK